MSNKIDIERKYKKLTHIEHILLRPERHLGSIRSSVGTVWIYDPTKEKVIFRDNFEYSPALIKQFDEIITNCVDHSKTPEGKGLTEITVTVSPMNGQIIVSDNGGIPVVKHGVTNEWLPEMLFGSLYAGSNFNDEDEEYNNQKSGGQNGEGASLVNVFSKWFRVATSDGKKSYTQLFEDNMSKKSNPVIGNTPKEFGTTIAWIPDYARLGVKGLDQNNLLMIYRRAFEVAACNPRLKVVLNGKQIRIDRFGHFVDYFYAGSAVDETDDWSVAITPSSGAFMHASYVNSIATHIGGPHVDYVADQIVAAIRPQLVKKFKTELKPAMIKNHMSLFIAADINNPRFDSQTKERMTTPVSQFGTSYKPSDKLIRKALEFVTAGLSKELASLRNEQEDAEFEKAKKDISKRDYREIEKYYPATARGDRSGCSLLLTEGDSASNPILNARDTKKIGLFPLRGKFINCLNAPRSKVMANEEFKNLCTIHGGAVPGQPLDISRYPQTVVATDADDDGIHIRGLLITLYCTFWPEYVRQGRLKLLRTPYMRVWCGNIMHEFMNNAEYEEFLKTPDAKKITKKKYLKGLGGNSTEDFKRILNNLDAYTTTVTLDDGYKQSLKNGFGDEAADYRKTWFSDVCLFETEDE
ncbi:DNA topoisomerase [Salmonella phage vB_SentM_Phi_10]|uniref:DNA topoisomerase 2 n=1 Tax=Salmonella phage vB_SenM-2 TaxID=1868843 RepID=A0A1X9I962_9CAUD|nr:DNA topoisomerase II [Salmonella phage vB_SenM-2]QFR58658.1 DNA topoisomerase [Salmonella phage vB_SentM_Phi_10]WPJ70433.1 type 2 topoisomerase subunit B [Salmonella phage RA148]